MPSPLWSLSATRHKTRRLSGNRILSDRGTRQEIETIRYSAETRSIPGKPTRQRGGELRLLASPFHCPAAESSEETPFENRRNQWPMRARRRAGPQPREGSNHHYPQDHLVLLAEQLPRSLGLDRERFAELGRHGPSVTARQEPSRLEQS